MVYHFRIHKKDRILWAECLELAGCQTQGRNLDELSLHAREALELYLAEPEDSRVEIPLPRNFSGRRDILEVPVPVGMAFAILLRHLRQKRQLTQTQAASLLKIRNLSAYQRLESLTRANPELKTLAKIKKVFPEMKLDQVLEHFPGSVR